MAFSSSQKGVSLSGGLVMLLLAVFAISTALKLAPHYLEFREMQSIIEAAKSNQGLGITTVSDFYSYVEKGMQLNSIRDIDLKQALKVTVENNAFNVRLNYEQREPLILNIDVVLKFDKQLSVGKL